MTVRPTQTGHVVDVGVVGGVAAAEEPADTAALVTSDVSDEQRHQGEALPLLRALGRQRTLACGLLGCRSRRGASRRPPILCGSCRFATRRSTFERGLDEVRELRVLLAALVDNLVKEVPVPSHSGHRSAGDGHVRGV